MREICRNSGAYVPLEAFRLGSGGADALGTKAVRTFRSSGTTQATRAESRFSSEGLDKYRKGSVAAFFDMLKKASDVSANSFVGISLIPAVGEWNDSSLAQMVEWIGDSIPVTYATEASLASVVAEVGDRPVFVFGTAFHFVNWLDRGGTAALPAGSLVIETGGTKGQSRSVTREELYAELARAFAVGEKQIVSEYGMCELASQAYDVEESDGSRHFRFPPWVTVSVLTAPGQIADKGRGALIVDDPLRVDIGLPVRTEDLVELEKDGAFRLLGRAEQAPLRGCSLFAEEILADALSRAPVATETVPWEPEKIVARAEEFQEFFEAFLASPMSLKCLAAELNSESAALSALDDLATCAPVTTDDWLASAQHARGKSDPASAWLLVLPENHSLVGIYPIAVAFVLGLNLTVRLPKRFADGRNLIRRFAEGLADLPTAKITIETPALRVGGERDSMRGSVLCYGSDETVAAIRAAATGRTVQGFGNRIGVSLLPASRFEKLAPRLAKDAFSLGQRGCMATRVAVVVAKGPVVSQKFASVLARAGAEFWGASLGWRWLASLDAERLRLQSLGFNFDTELNERSPLIAVKKVANVTAFDLAVCVSRQPFVLPLVVVEDKDSVAFVKALAEQIHASRELSVASCDALETTDHKGKSLVKSHYVGLSFRELGKANAPTWDGYHESRPLFSHT